MIALDTNILVYAARADAPHHAAALALVRGLAEGSAAWAIPWPCLYEFIKVLTHPRIFQQPTTLDEALEDAEALLDSPTVVMLGESPAHRGHLRRAVAGGEARGNLVHDAHVAALVIEHGIAELLTADRDFARFPGVRARNPFTG